MTTELPETPAPTQSTPTICIYKDPAGEQVTLPGHWYRRINGEWACDYCGWKKDQT